MIATVMCVNSRYRDMTAPSSLQHWPPSRRLTDVHIGGAVSFRLAHGSL